MGEHGGPRISPHSTLGGPKRLLVQFGGQRPTLGQGSAPAPQVDAKPHLQGSTPVHEILSSRRTAAAGSETSALFDSKTNQSPRAVVEAWFFVNLWAACRTDCLLDVVLPTTCSFCQPTPEYPILSEA
jgi:hypothetical protein